VPAQPAQRPALGRDAPSAARVLRVAFHCTPRPLHLAKSVTHLYVPRCAPVRTARSADRFFAGNVHRGSVSQSARA